MPPRKRTSSVLNGDEHDEPNDGLPTVEGEVPSLADAQSLEEQAEAAEAEAAEAEALAAAARARTKALRLRRQAVAAATKAAAIPAPTVVLEKQPPTVEPEGAEATKPDAPTADPVKDADAEDIELDEDDELDEDEPGSRRRVHMPHVSLRIAAAALVVLVSLGLCGASGYMMWQHRQVAAEQQRSAEFAAAARQSVVTLMSLDFNSAEADVKRILDNTTGDFRKDFEGQAAEFTKVAKESKVVTEATVNATAVDKMTRDTATVLVAVTTNVSNAASKQQQPRSWRLSVDVARDGDQIKLAKVEFVP